MCPRPPGQAANTGDWHAIPYGIRWRLRTAGGNVLPRSAGRNCAKQFRGSAGNPGGVMPEPTEGPTVLRILLGTQLRRLRESRSISAQEAARAIRGSESKISRIELGRNAIREIDVLDLLTYYGVAAVEREQLLSLAEQANRPGWWHRYNDILPDWFQSYVGREEAATSIRVYEPQCIPALLPRHPN